MAFQDHLCLNGIYGKPVTRSMGLKVPFAVMGHVCWKGLVTGVDMITEDGVSYCTTIFCIFVNLAVHHAHCHKSWSLLNRSLHIHLYHTIIWWRSCVDNGDCISRLFLTAQMITKAPTAHTNQNTAHDRAYNDCNQNAQA